MKYEELISNANLALGGGKYNVALDYANKAIVVNKDGVDGYVCAGKASVSLGELDKAEKFFMNATQIEKNNGNIYFLLGYVQTMMKKSAQALVSLTNAIEKNCNDPLKGQVYKVMSLINRDKGDYANALANLNQAEKYFGLDYDILEQKATCYAGMKDYRQSVFTLNQMKLIKPREYTSYSMAFRIFFEMGRFPEAAAELKRAEEFADLLMPFYDDKVRYTLFHVGEQTDEERNLESLRIVQKGLEQGKPTAKQVFDSYIQCAQMYLTLNRPDNSIKLLDAAINPVTSYNNGIKVYSDSNEVIEEANNRPILSPEETEQMMQERWDNGELDEFRDQIALGELDGEDPFKNVSAETRKSLTPLDAFEQDYVKENPYRLEEEYVLNQVERDSRNVMYLFAYEKLGEYERMLDKAKELQASSLAANQYNGIYYELKANKYLNKVNWEKKYRERISYWTKQLLANPNDYVSAGFRIKCYIDLEDFANAESLCACLPNDVRASLMQEINLAKAKQKRRQKLEEGVE